MLCHKQSGRVEVVPCPTPSLSPELPAALQLYLGPRLRGKVANLQAGGTDLATLVF